MHLTWQRRNLHLRHPFNIARAQTSHTVDKQVLLVRIMHDDRVGWGEAAPSTYYRQSLDSAESVFAAAGEIIGDDPFALDRILDTLWARFPDQSAAIAAIDGALHDLIGKLLDIPIWKMLGLDRSRCPLTSFTIGLDDPEAIAGKLREAVDYPILKIKVGTAQDAAILKAIRRVAPDKPLRVDANCGWSSADVLERCRRMADFGVELIEQPTPRGEHAGLPAVRAAGLPPLLADESCINLDEVLPCAEAFDGINIKLCKCGGIRRALPMIHAAQATGLKVMLGCMVETSVGIAAAAQLAPLADYIDLDGHLLLADDPFEGIGGTAGRLTLNDEPGLGIRERQSV
ncbi:MAG: dipeptide epimerase [Phycisphaerales bacterium]|nr:dipeptide epimerase [Phycisphaerales bacterium]